MKKSKEARLYLNGGPIYFSAGEVESIEDVVVDDLLVVSGTYSMRLFLRDGDCLDVKGDYSHQENEVFVFTEHYFSISEKTGEVEKYIGENDCRVPTSALELAIMHKKNAEAHFSPDWNL